MPALQRTAQVLDLLTDPVALDRILRHVGLPVEPPLIAAARSPPIRNSSSSD